MENSVIYTFAFSLIVFLAGLFLLGIHGWQIACGVFLIVWANNIAITQGGISKNIKNNQVDSKKIESEILSSGYLSHVEPKNPSKIIKRGDNIDEILKN